VAVDLWATRRAISLSHQRRASQSEAATASLFQISKRTAQDHLVKSAIFLLLLSGQPLCAGLEKYSQVVVSDAPSRTPLPDVRVTYLGTNGFEFRWNRHALLVDPYFSRISLSRVAFGASIQPDSERIDAAMKYLSSEADAILITHGHFDHLLDAPLIMQKNRARLVASRTAVQLAERAGVAASRCDTVTARNVRRIGPWKIHVLAATHDRLFSRVPFAGEPRGNAPPRRAADWVCGEPLAFLIEIDGLRIYVDSGGTPAVLPPTNIAPVDLAILGVALPDSRTRFAEAVRRLRPRYVFPSHQDNFFQPLSAGFAFGPLTNFPALLRDYKMSRLPGRLILLDYFRPWTLPRK
jgi:L-ascorbate metabolism protein UlaG (beta-lactamase superfamily)